jgi:AcrR family transcriptional regulator
MTHHLPDPDIAVRERLLAAALQLFTARGYAATTVREIVETAGVTKPSLYYYFNSKEGIYLALMQGAGETFEATLGEILAGGGTAREQILRFCSGMFSVSRAHLDLVRLMYAMFFGPPQGAPHYEFDALFTRMLATITDIVNTGITTGEFKPLPARELTWGIMGIFNTILEEQLSQPNPRIDEAGLVATLSIFLDGIRQGEPR